MNDSPRSKGPVHSRGTGAEVCNRPVDPDRLEPHQDHYSPPPNSVRHPAPASRTCGRDAVDPAGSILDTDASFRRAHKQADNGQKKITTKNRRVTGPAPSGMRCFSASMKDARADTAGSVISETTSLRRCQPRRSQCGGRAWAR